MQNDRRTVIFESRPSDLDREARNRPVLDLIQGIGFGSNGPDLLPSGDGGVGSPEQGSNRAETWPWSISMACVVHQANQGMGLGFGTTCAAAVAGVRGEASSA